MSSVVFIDEARVRSLLNWPSTFKAVETAMKKVSKKEAVQNPRSYTKVLNGDTLLLTMPGFLADENYGALACKLVTSTPSNSTRSPPLGNILANIALFDETTGELKAIVAGTEITTWRTAAASAVATKVLRDGKQDRTLAILGAGVQGRIHAIAFQHFFKYKEVRIWNHKPAKARDLVQELNAGAEDGAFVFREDVECCVRGADVIVTVTAATSPILKLDWIKAGAHINAVGAGGGNHHSELEPEVYSSSDVYIDYWEGAKTELAGLEKIGIRFKGVIGALIEGSLQKSAPNKNTIFQSLGMAAEDCAMARLIYDLHMKKN